MLNVWRIAHSLYERVIEAEECAPSGPLQIFDGDVNFFCPHVGLDKQGYRKGGQATAHLLEIAIRWYGKR